MTFFFNFLYIFKGLGQASPFVKSQPKFEKFPIFWYALLFNQTKAKHELCRIILHCTHYFQI